MCYLCKSVITLTSCAMARTKGAQNKSTLMGKEIISELLSHYAATGLMDKDFKELAPKDRMMIFEKLLNYIMPKQSSTSMDVSTSSRKTIEDILADMAE